MANSAFYDMTSQCLYLLRYDYSLTMAQERIRDSLADDFDTRSMMSSVMGLVHVCNIELSKTNPKVSHPMSRQRVTKLFKSSFFKRSIKISVFFQALIQKISSKGIYFHTVHNKVYFHTTNQPDRKNPKQCAIN